MGTTDDFLELIQSTTGVSLPGRGRIRLFGSEWQQSINGAAWSAFGGGDGVQSIVPSARIDIDDSDPENPIPDLIAGSVADSYLASGAKLTGLLRRKMGTNLVDNTQSIAPGSDKASQYDLPLATPLTANRVLTLADTGSPVTGHMCCIRSFDTSAFTFEVRNSAAASLFTFAASAAAGSIREAWFYFNGTRFAYFPTLFYLQST